VRWVTFPLAEIAREVLLSTHCVGILPMTKEISLNVVRMTR